MTSEEENSNGFFGYEFRAFPLINSDFSAFPVNFDAKQASGVNLALQRFFSAPFYISLSQNCRICQVISLLGTFFARSLGLFPYVTQIPKISRMSRSPTRWTGLLWLFRGYKERENGANTLPEWPIHFPASRWTQRPIFRPTKLCAARFKLLKMSLKSLLKASKKLETAYLTLLMAQLSASNGQFIWKGLPKSVGSNVNCFSSGTR